jgi:lysophospholipase L1-like esterase
MKRALLLLLLLSACSSPPRTRAAPAPSAAQQAPAVERYLALGDSFTIGTGSTPDEAFPARLVARWTACDVTLKNVAVNGYTTQALIDRELPEVASFEPSFVTIAIGANDIVRGKTAAEYKGQLEKIFAAVKDVPRVVAIPQPDWSLSPAASSFGDPREIQARIVEYNAVLAAVARAHGATFVDLWSLMRRQADAGMLARDGLHPSAIAYDEWAQEIAKLVSCPK